MIQHATKAEAIAADEPVTVIPATESTESERLRTAEKVLSGCGYTILADTAQAAADAFDMPSMLPGFCPTCQQPADLYDADNHVALCANGHSHTVSSLTRNNRTKHLRWRAARDFNRLLSIAADVDARIDAFEPPARIYPVNMPHQVSPRKMLGCRVAQHRF